MEAGEIHVCLSVCVCNFGLWSVFVVLHGRKVGRIPLNSQRDTFPGCITSFNLIERYASFLWALSDRKKKKKILADN